MFASNEFWSILGRVLSEFAISATYMTGSQIARYGFGRLWRPKDEITGQDVDFLLYTTTTTTTGWKSVEKNSLWVRAFLQSLHEFIS